MKPYSTFHLIMIFLGSLVLLFIIAPLAGLFLQSGSDEIVDTLRDEEVLKSIRLTMFTAMIATLLGAVSAIPLAYVLSRRTTPFKNVINAIVDIPVVIPHSAAGIALLGVLSRHSVLGGTLNQLGLDFIGHPLGISMAMAFVSVPFLINAARDGFAAVPIRLEKAALSLGASPLRVFFTVSLPLARRSIVTGLIMMFARGMSEFGAVIFIAYHPMITPILIFERFNAFGLKYARPVAFVFVVVCLIFFIAVRHVSKKRSHV